MSEKAILLPFLPVFMPNVIRQSGKNEYGESGLSMTKSIRAII
jgi:hypothetical protein